MTSLPVQYAALINVGCNPFISLIITIVVVGIIVWLAVFILGLLTIVAEPFKSIAIKVIYALAGLYLFCVALQIIFGIVIFAGMTPIGC